MTLFIPCLTKVMIVRDSKNRLSSSLFVKPLCLDLMECGSAAGTKLCAFLLVFDKLSVLLSHISWRVYLMDDYDDWQGLSDYPNFEFLLLFVSQADGIEDNLNLEVFSEEFTRWFTNLSRMKPFFC